MPGVVIEYAMLAGVGLSEEYSRARAQEREVAEHLDDEHDPGSDVAETHRREDGHAEVQGVGAGQRLGKLATEARSIKKYIEANSTR